MGLLFTFFSIAQIPSLIVYINTLEFEERDIRSISYFISSSFSGYFSLFFSVLEDFIYIFFSDISVNVNTNINLHIQLNARKIIK